MNQARVMMSLQKPFRGKISNPSKDMGTLIIFEDIRKNHSRGLDPDGKKKNEFLSLSVKQPHVNCWVVSRYDG